MSRHSKNNTAGAVFTYHERAMMKDHGTLLERLSAQSLYRFGLCWLCFLPARDPLASAHGHIFCKECILENLSFQHQQNKTAVAKDLDKHRTAQARSAEQERLQKEAEARHFAEEQFGVSSKLLPKIGDTVICSRNKKCIKMDKTQASSAFWVAQATPSAEPPPHPAPVEKRTLLCPASRKPLKLKHLFPLKPKMLGDQWICSLSAKPLNHQAIIANRKTGEIMTRDAAVQCQLVPDSGPLGRHFVPLVSSQTSFSSHNPVTAATFRPVMD